MVKNIPTIERSTKIRFGKYATDDQGENTIVFNASNVAIDASGSGSIYMTPLRSEDIRNPDVKILTYNRTTKEVLDSNVTSDDIFSMNLEFVTNNDNVTSNTVRFINDTTSFVTTGNVGIQNINPTHALDVGSQFHVTEGGEVRVGPSILIDSGGVNQIQVSGKIVTSSLVSSNIGISNNNPTKKLSIGSHTFVDDPATTGNTITTSGNVSAAFYHGDSYYLSNLNLNNIVLQGNTTASRTVQFNYADGPALITNGNVGIQNTHGIHTLDVGSNLFVDDIGSDILNVTGNVNATNYLKSKKLEVSEDAIISGNLTVEGTTTFIDTINTVFKDPIISLANNNPSASTDIGIIMQQPNSNANPTVTFRGDENEMMIGYTLNSASDTEIVPDLSNVIDLHVYGNIIAQNNLTLTSGELTAITLNGNVNASGNIETTSGFFKGDGGILSNVTLQQVTDTSNSTSNTVLFTNAHTAFTTDLTSNVGVKLDQLSNVIITSPDDHKSLLYIDGNWIDDYIDFTSIEVKAGEALSKGDVVYIHDGSGDTPEVRKADSSSASTMPAIGIVMDGNIDHNNNGHVVTFGTFGMAFDTNFQKGEILYVSNTTPGGLMNTVPFSNTDKIQNVGIVVKSGSKILVTGVGRSNDIPNAEEVYAQPTYVYVNSSGNELKKILASNLSANNQTLDMVTSWSNSTQNTIQSTHQTTGFISSGNIHVGSNIFVSGLTDSINKYLTMADKDTGKLIKSPVYVTTEGKYVIDAAEAEFTGNLTFTGNATTFSSNNVVIQDRIFGLGANNAVHNLDMGILMEHKETSEGSYANVALIYHADEHRFSVGYTQNTFTDDHILHYQDPDHVITLDILGNALVQNNLTLVHGNLTTITVNSNVVGDNVVATNIYGTIAGANTISASTISATDTVTSISTSGNVLVTGNVTANKFYGDGSAITSLDPSRLSSQVLITEGGTGLTSVAQNELLLGPASGTALSTLPPYAPGDSTKKFLRSSATGIAWDDVPSTLQEITNSGNTTSNIVRFTNATTGIEITSNIDFVNKITLKSTSGTKSNLFVVNAIQLDPDYAEPSRNVLSFDTITGEIYDAGGVNGDKFYHISEENANVLIGSNLTINSLGSNVLTVSGNVSADNITIGGLNVAASPFGLDDVVSSAVGSNVTSNVLTLGGVITDTLTVSGNTTSQNIKLTNTDITASVTSGTITVDAKEKTYGTAPLVVSTTDVSNLVFSNLITGAQIVIPILASGSAINISSAMTNVNFYAMTSNVSVAQDKHALMTLSNLYGNIYMNAIGFS